MEFLWAQVANDNVVLLPDEETPIQQFYAGKTALVTGGSGTLGKLLIAKILKFCPRIERIYLILRAKNLAQMASRTEEIFSYPIFDDIQRSAPQSLSKISIIRGDLSHGNLNISEKDAAKLVSETEIIFHLAASSLFDDNLKTAVEVNVRATQGLLNLAKRMKKLKVLVHGSTLFGNCHRNVVDEVVERPFVSAKALIEFMESMDPNIYYPKPINLGEIPNNFVLTKSIAEELIKNENKSLPVVIVRYPLLIPCYRYPFKGYTENINSLMGITMTTYIGLNKSILAKKDLNAEIFPVDLAVNALIAIGWDTANSKALNDNMEVPNEDNLLVYNLTTSKCNRLPWKLYFGLCNKFIHRYPTMYSLAFPWHILHAKKQWHFILITLLHYIPGYFVDFCTLYLFYKAKYIGYYTKIDMLSRTLTYFTTRAWNVRDGNVRKLIRVMCEDDRELFDFDASKIDWESYFENMILGIRKFILKDEESTLLAARKRQFKCLMVLVMNLIVLGVIAVVIVYFLVGF